MTTLTESTQTMEMCFETLFDALNDYHMSVEGFLKSYGAVRDGDDYVENKLAMHLRRIELFTTDLGRESSEIDDLL